MATDSVAWRAQSTALPLDIALSGGGVRAMAFHAGVLGYLAEQNALECVRHISSVSGGSLLVGLIFHESGMRWPTSTGYLQNTLPSLRYRLTTCDLQGQALKELARPTCWRFLLSRANVLARVIERCWGVRATLAELPDAPVWSINATTAETGRRFRFKSTGCGDYRLGYADAGSFPLAQALAVSAAFPGAIGPLAITCKDYVWKKRPDWNAPVESLQAVQLPFTRLHLYDGGLYDNLGLEPLFDVGAQKSKAADGCLVVSDAGAPLTDGFDFHALSPGRMKRWLYVVMEQQRALRVRALVHALERGLPGVYLQIGACATERLKTTSHAEGRDTEWLTSAQAREIAASPTSLSRFSGEQFDRLYRHGRETAFWNQLAYPYLP